MSKISDLDNRLRQKGLRATAQRLMICKEIDRAGHIDIDTLYERLKTEIPSLSLATIYKNMHSLVEKDIISEVSIEGKKTMYEISIDNHIHHVCTRCGHIEDIEYNVMNMVSSIRELSGRNVSGCKLTTFGICSRCMSN
jgi:Fur family peroxide stress response transcriptional regulator